MSSIRPSTLRTGSAHDVIVVGAQAAGAATAMLLAGRALRVLLLDHGSFGSDTPPTHALMRGGVLQLSRWGLLDEIIDAGTPPVKRSSYRFGDEHVTISIKPSHGVDALYAPRRTVLDPLLVQAALDAGVDVHLRTSVTDLIMRDGRVVGVRATTADRRSVDLGAALVIGADGIRSTIAQRVGASFSRVAEHASAIAYGYWSDLATDGYEWIFRPNACSAVIPTSDGLTWVSASASPERVGSGGVALIEDVVAEGAPELAERLRTASAPRRAQTSTGHRGYIRRSHGPGWALVGDAGYFIDPVIAHGLTDALRDAELLAHAVVDGIGGSTSLDNALDDYQSTRDRLGIPLFDVVDRIASHEWDDAEIAQLLLRISSATADVVETIAALEPDEVS